MTEYASQLFWNAIAPVADQSGAVIPGTLIKGGQEVVYSKIIRKISGYDQKSYMELVMFSLVTQSTDMGFGAWYGKHKPGKEAGFMDVLMEAIRPILSCLVVNYIFNTSTSESTTQSSPSGSRSYSSSWRPKTCPPVETQS